MAVITIGLKHGHFTLNFDDKFSNLTTPMESLTCTLLFWHFLENLNFEFKNIFEYIRAMFSGNT